MQAAPNCFFGQQVLGLLCSPRWPPKTSPEPLARASRSAGRPGRRATRSPHPTTLSPPARAPSASLGSALAAPSSMALCAAMHAGLRSPWVPAARPAAAAPPPSCPARARLVRRSRPCPPARVAYQEAATAEDNEEADYYGVSPVCRAASSSGADALQRPCTRGVARLLQPCPCTRTLADPGGLLHRQHRRDQARVPVRRGTWATWGAADQRTAAVCTCS